MNSTRRFNLEVLEEREVPSASIFGNAWLDGSHLTLSFAPDGADISGVSSRLTVTLNAASSDAARELLRAVQTWAVEADINIGIVADGGLACRQPDTAC